MPHVETVIWFRLTNLTNSYVFDDKYYYTKQGYFNWWYRADPNYARAAFLTNSKTMPLKSKGPFDGWVNYRRCSPRKAVKSVGGILCHTLKL